MNAPLTPLEQRIVSLVARRAAQQPAAIGVWVFGSRARGDSDEDSDLDLAVEFSSVETAALRQWLEHVRQKVEGAVLDDQWPGLLDLVGLYPNDVDPRLTRQVRVEGELAWQREPATACA